MIIQKINTYPSVKYHVLHENVCKFILCACMIGQQPAPLFRRTDPTSQETRRGSPHSSSAGSAAASLTARWRNLWHKLILVITSVSVASITCSHHSCNHVIVSSCDLTIYGSAGAASDDESYRGRCSSNGRQKLQCRMSRNARRHRVKLVFDVRDTVDLLLWHSTAAFWSFDVCAGQTKVLKIRLHG